MRARQTFLGLDTVRNTNQMCCRMGRFMTHRCAKADGAGWDEVERRVHILAVLPHVQHQALGEGRRQAGPLGHVREHIRHGAVHGPVRQPSAAQFLPWGVPEVRCTCKLG